MWWSEASLTHTAAYEISAVIFGMNHHFSSLLGFPVEQNPNLSIFTIYNQDFFFLTYHSRHIRPVTDGRNNYCNNLLDPYKGECDIGKGWEDRGRSRGSGGRRMYSRTAQHGEFSDGSEGGEGMEEERQNLAQIENVGE